MLKKFGWEKASWALVFTGFIIAIPVFLDVGFVILIPIIYALGRETKRSLLLYGIPLLAGLAVTHAFIPPTPGPVAVAQILDAQLGWIIIFGIIVGIPTAIIAGPIFGKYISKKIQLSPPDYFTSDKGEDKPEIYPSFRTVVLIIALPLVLIIIHSVTEILYKNDIMISENVYQIFALIGHPFTALTIATLLALYVLGYKKGFSKAKLSRLSGKALGPAGLIILVTGAGGVFKQVLIDSGVGEPGETHVGQIVGRQTAGDHQDLDAPLRGDLNGLRRNLDLDLWRFGPGCICEDATDQERQDQSGQGIPYRRPPASSSSIPGSPTDSRRSVLHHMYPRE